MAISHAYTSIAQKDFAGSGSFTFNHTSGTGDNRYLFVNTLGYDIGTGITNVTCNGTSLTILRDYVPTGFPFGANCPRMRVWGLANPPSAVSTIEVFYTNISGNAVASTYNGASPNQGVTRTESASTAGQQATWSQDLPSYSGGENWVIGFTAMYNTGKTTTAGADTTSRGVTGDGGGGSFMISDNNGNTAVDTLNWGMTPAGSAFWTSIDFELVAYRPGLQQMLII